MADVVQYKLERMLNELDDLERRGLFTRREIAEIVKQRRKFEYRLKRRSPLKDDFLAYIDYEKKLDELRLLRRKAFLMQQSGKNKRWKKSLSDYAGVVRIVEIYRSATIRFKGDIELWFQYLEFCKQRSNGRMKKALAQLIRFHPKVPGVWIYAAAWEFDRNLNVAAARALMQNGLRACPTSEDLWVEYLRMELTYLNKLKARKVALGEDEGTLVLNKQETDEKKWKDENKDLFMALDEVKEDKSSNVQDLESEEQSDLFKEQGLSILRTVYHGAIEALPSSFNLRTRFLEILEAIDLADSDDMRNTIFDDLERDFSKQPEYWDWLARYGSLDLKSKAAEEISCDHFSKAVKVYENGLEVVPSATMFDLYAKFLIDAINNKIQNDKSSEHFSSSGLTLDPISHLLTTYEKAESTGCMSENLACQHVSFLLKLGKLDEAKMLVEKLCTNKFSDSTKIWTLWLSIELRSVDDQPQSLRKENLSSIFDLLRKLLKKFATLEAENLWLMALKCFGHHKHYFDKLLETSLLALTENGGSDEGFSVSSIIINAILQRDGIQKAREMYKRYLGLPHPGLVLYKTCIELEMNLACAGNNDGLINARKLYETALTTYDQDVSLWRDYYLMEVKIGIPEKAAAVHWRAQKTLKHTVLLTLTDI